MKIAEVRQKISAYSAEQLRVLVAEMYKAIPKNVKEEQDIDSMIGDPMNRKRARQAETRVDLDELRFETEEFLENAYAQNYFAPNSLVPKRERPKWRFIAKRLFKQLNQAAQNSADRATACALLEKLYEMLCYACDYVLFSSYDPFQSVGIEQTDLWITTFERAVQSGISPRSQLTEEYEELRQKQKRSQVRSPQ